MSEQPTQEQVKEFWEWCGKRYELKNSYGELVDIHYPPIDLNNLFKYAVPKLENLHGFGRKVTMALVSGWGECSDDYGVEIRDNLTPPFRMALKFNQNPALALFWALWQVKEEQDDK